MGFGVWASDSTHPLRELASWHRICLLHRRDDGRAEHELTLVAYATLLCLGIRDVRLRFVAPGRTGLLIALQLQGVRGGVVRVDALLYNL